MLFLWGLLDQSAHSDEIGELACLGISTYSRVAWYLHHLLSSGAEFKILAKDVLKWCAEDGGVPSAAQPGGKRLCNAKRRRACIAMRKDLQIFVKILKITTGHFAPYWLVDKADHRRDDHVLNGLLYLFSSIHRLLNTKGCI